MTRGDLIIKIANEMNLSQELAKSIIKKALDEIIESLASEGKVELRSFGVLTTKLRKARIGRNPLKGTAVQIPARKVVSFKPGQALKEKLKKSLKTNS